MAAFAIGLIGDKSGREPLIAALGDPSLLVQGSAAESLGLGRIRDEEIPPPPAQVGQWRTE